MLLKLAPAGSPYSHYDPKTGKGYQAFITYKECDNSGRVRPNARRYKKYRVTVNGVDVRELIKRK